MKSKGRLGSWWVGLVLVAGCATTARYEARLDAWVGRDASDLVAAWGEPDTSRPVSDGERALTWNRTRSINRPTPTKAITTGYPTSADAFARRTTIDRCETTFTVSPMGRLLRWQWKGNGCVSR